MSRFPPPWLRGSLSLVCLIVNTVLWCIPFYLFGIARTVVPIDRFRHGCARVLMWLGAGWISCNSILLDLIHRVDWEVHGLEGLRDDRWYLVICNHQTWADIPILQRTFNRRVPFLKFFLKQELIWVPLLGLAWWFLDYPFMKRYPRAVIEKHPELRGKDLETTRRVCRRFQHSPVSVLNFLEGTRLNAAKHAAQRSPYRHLLRPKAGGVAFVLDAMGERFGAVLDVTIVYPNGAPDFWQFLSGHLDRVIIHVEERPIPGELLDGDYLGDEAFRERFQRWVQSLWEEKDRRIESLREQAAAAGSG